MDHSVYELLMKQALIEAKRGFDEGEVPVGAVIAGPDGDIISSAHNQPISLNDPTAHAEILALRRAGEVLKNYRLNDVAMVVTVEPCLMCIGAAIHSRISTLVFGAFDPVLKMGHQMMSVIEERIARSIANTDRELRLKMEEVGLHDIDRLLNSYPHELSGGQLQRCQLAMVMVIRPQLLIVV